MFSLVVDVTIKSAAISPGGLVEQQYTGGAQNSAGDSNALLLATRDLAGLANQRTIPCAE